MEWGLEEEEGLMEWEGLQGREEQEEQEQEHSVASQGQVNRPRIHLVGMEEVILFEIQHLIFRFQLTSED